MNGKNDGRSRTSTSRPKTAESSVFSAWTRCPTFTSRSTTRPSIWWNVFSWVASSASWRKTRPIATARIGGLRVSIARTCTGEVWVRSRWPSSSQNVSCVSRAGWSVGMLSASKLWRSSSTQGPSRTSKPIERKRSSSSRRICVTGWSVPPPRRAPGMVASTHSRVAERALARRRAARRGGPRGAPSTAVLRVVRGAADGPALGRRERAEAAEDLLEAPAPAEPRGPERLEGLHGRRGGDGGLRLACQLPRSGPASRPSRSTSSPGTSPGPRRERRGPGRRPPSC